MTQRTFEGIPQRTLLEFLLGVSSGHTEQLSDPVSLGVPGPSPCLAGKGPDCVDRGGRKIRSNSIGTIVATNVDSQRLAPLPRDMDPIEFGDSLLSAVQPESVAFSIGREHCWTPNPETVGLLRNVLPNAGIVCTQLFKHCSQRLAPSRQSAHLTEAFAQGHNIKMQAAVEQKLFSWIVLPASGLPRAYTWISFSGIFGHPCAS